MTPRSAVALAFLVAACGSAPTHWVSTWAVAPQPPMQPKVYENVTLRLIVHTSVGGKRVRIRIANAFEGPPLVIGGAHIAKRTEGSSVDPQSDRVLRFSGRASTEIPPRSTVWSDPVDLDVPPFADLAVSLFVPKATHVTSTHVLALQTSYVSPPTGDATGAVTLPVASTIRDWPFLSAVDVAARPGAFTVVAFGDSTVDGDGSSPDANLRWPDVLAARASGIGVANAGIIGNRLLHDSPPGGGLGPAALARFDGDALGQSGIKIVILHLGVNDIGFPGVFAPASEAVTIDAMSAGFRELVSRARRRGVRVIGSTISPFEATTIAPGYYTPEKEVLRGAVNDWIRNGGAFDAVVDFDQVLRDPEHPSRLRPAFDSGDHLHPSDAGYRAMAEAVPLSILK